MRGQGVVVTRRMGLLDEVRAARVEEQGLMFVDHQGRPQGFFGRVETGGNGGKQSFTSEYEIMRGELCRILNGVAAKKDNVKFVFGTTVEGLEQDDIV